MMSADSYDARISFGGWGVNLANGTPDVDPGPVRLEAAVNQTWYNRSH